MGARRRLIIHHIGLVSMAAALSMSATACKRKEQAPAPPAASAKTTDHLAKDEIPEGRERAFTLPLPLHSKVKARFATSVHVASQHTQEELANFIKARVKDGKTTSGASGTRFDQVVVTKDPSKTLTIEVHAAAIMGDEYKSQIVINDVSPLPETPGMTDADRWKRAGFTPDGKPLDPKHMQ